MTYPNDPNFRDPTLHGDPNLGGRVDPAFRHELARESDREGTATATWASIAFVLLLFGGVAIWAYYSSDGPSVTAQRPGIEQPATTGQGGAASRMPAAKEKDAR